jgi:signal transduction histidine kinase
MLFDDRLDTVLRSPAGGERAARTQYRQLVDLIGSSRDANQSERLGEGLQRLTELEEAIPAEQRAAIIREPGMRLRNPRLVALLAESGPPVAVAAMASARLDEDGWNAIIPQLPIPARGLLRHRNDLPEATSALLARLGVKDLVLPLPAGFIPAVVSAGADKPVLELDPDLEEEDVLVLEQEEGIGALVNRIEAFRKARQTGSPGAIAPRLPLDDRLEEPPRKLPKIFDFSTNAAGRVDWADPAEAPMIVGFAIPGPVAKCSPDVQRALISRQPIRDGRIELEGAPAIAGSWRIDATPHFALEDGHFTGFRGRLRRYAEQPAPSPKKDETPEQHAADRVRQMLHELRTPVNAIQGFAEVIQQQVFGKAPNEYRALAAAIGVDIARIQAGFDELERFARLEAGSLELTAGESDLRATAAETIKRLEGVLRPRSAGFEFLVQRGECNVTMVDEDLQQLCWRLLATLAGAVAPGEVLEVTLDRLDGKAILTAELPAAMDESDEIFVNARGDAPRAVSAGPFGTGFALRLARAEARAVSGDLVRQENRLVLNLPLFIGQYGDDRGQSGGNIAQAG